MLKEFIDSAKELYTAGHDAVRPSSLKGAIEGVAAWFKGNDQHDAQELLVAPPSPWLLSIHQAMRSLTWTLFPQVFLLAALHDQLNTSTEVLTPDAAKRVASARRGASSSNVVRAFACFCGAVQVVGALTLCVGDQTGDGNESGGGETADSAWQEHKRYNKSVILDLFRGQLVSSVRCSACGGLSQRWDPFMYLSLPLPLQD